MDESLTTTEITEHYIDLEGLLHKKGVKLPKWVLRFLVRYLHVDEINEAIYEFRDLDGVGFSNATLKKLNISVQMEGAHRIPAEGSPILAGNHPLGAADGMALIGAVGSKRGDLKFPVNDFLLALPSYRSVFLPVDKVHRNTRGIKVLEESFAGTDALLIFPAGLCSRLIKGRVRDTQWKPTFIKKAVRYQRDVVPVFFDAKNRRRFYLFARLRKALGVKFNIEMAMLPSELFAKRNKTFRVVVGKPIPYSTFDNRHTPQEWADLMHDFVYQLKTDPNAVFGW